MNTKILLSETVHVRLTPEQQERLEARAEARGMTLSEWARDVLREALDSSPMERRLTAFVAAQTVAIRLAMEEWQQGKSLSNPDVQERIERLALEASKAFGSQIKKSGDGL